jgi:hypothetical protein
MSSYDPRGRVRGKKKKKKANSGYAVILALRYYQVSGIGIKNPRFDGLADCAKTRHHAERFVGLVGSWGKGNPVLVQRGKGSKGCKKRGKHETSVTSQRQNFLEPARALA